MALEITTEFIEKNFAKINKSCDTFVKNQKTRAAVKEMLNFFDERYFMCPASTKDAFYCAFPGGLTFHTVNLFKNCIKLANTFLPKVAPESLFITSFLSQFGKVGDTENDYYIPTKSDWHKKRGIHYEINPEITYMKVPHRSLYLANHFDLKLSQEEYLSILLSEGQNDDTNNHYRYKQPNLAQLLSSANEWTIKLEKDIDIVRP